MSDLIVVIDSSEILEGKLEELKAAMKDLVEFVQLNEPRPVAYKVYLNENGTRVTVFQVHPDSVSMEYHMKVAGPAFPKLAELVKMLTMDVYGKPSDDLVEQMRKKAEMLGSGTVHVHDLHAGFARF